MATRMYACYRREDAADAGTMLDAAAVVLASYPDEVGEAVTHPVTGLPGRNKWPPNIAEVREACEIAMGPVRARMAREQAERETLAARAGDQPRSGRLSYDELKAKHGEGWGIRPPVEVGREPIGFYHRDRPLTAEERQSMYEQRRKG